MADDGDISHHTHHGHHRHRRQRKHRALKRRVLVVGAVVLFFLVWGLLVVWYQGYYKSKEVPVERYHSISPQFRQEK